MRPRQLDFAAENEDNRRGDDAEENSLRSAQPNRDKEEEPVARIQLEAAAGTDSEALTSEKPSDVSPPAVTAAHRQIPHGAGITSTDMQVDGSASQSHSALNSLTALTMQASASPVKQSPSPTQTDAVTLPRATAAAAAAAGAATISGTVSASASASGSHSSPQAPPSTQPAVTVTGSAATGMQAGAQGGRLAAIQGACATTAASVTTADKAAAAAASSSEAKAGLQAHTQSQADVQAQAQAQAQAQVQAQAQAQSQAQVTERSPGTVTPR